MSDWQEPAEAAIQDTLSQLAAEGKLNHGGQQGMLTHATIVYETLGEDGQLWWGVLQLPGDHGRDLLIHNQILGHHAVGWLTMSEDEDDAGTTSD